MNGHASDDQCSSSPGLEVGDRVLARYRGDPYRARVEAVGPGASVTVAWAPPHDRWGVATVDASKVEFVSRPPKPDALAHLLPGLLVDPRDGREVKLGEAFTDKEAVGVYFVDAATPPEATARLAAFAASLPANRLGLAIYEIGAAPLAESGGLAASPLPGAHSALLPGCLAVPPQNVATVLQSWNLVEVCRVRKLPSLCVVTRASEVLTYDGIEAIADAPRAFPWRGYRSRATRRLELKERCIRWASTLVGGILACVGALRVGSWILRGLGMLADLYLRKVGA